MELEGVCIPQRVRDGRDHRVLPRGLPSAVAQVRRVARRFQGSRGRLRTVKTTIGHIGIAALLLAGCGPTDAGDQDTDEGSASGGTQVGATDTAGSVTGAEGTSQDGSGESGPAPDVDFGPCLRVSACLDSQGVPAEDPLGRYGPNGTCWQDFPQPTCWAQCTALLESFSDNCEAEAPACCVCETELECAFDPANPTCSGGACTPAGGGGDCSTVSFASDIQPILDDNCVECHSPGGLWPSLDMSLDAYDDLVNADGIQTLALVDYMLVVPGDTELSYILHKLEGSQAEVAGAAAGEQMPLERPQLAQDLRDTIRTWIECGAPE